MTFIRQFNNLFCVNFFVAGKKINFAKQQPHWRKADTAHCSDTSCHSWLKNELICHRNSHISPVLFHSLCEKRANSDILIILSLLLPLPSPPISSRANSKLICNSHWWRNWCLILVLGNRIIQLMREWWKKIRGRERSRKKGRFYMKNYFILLLFSHRKILIKLPAWCKILTWAERTGLFPV